jgi:hypothetical protein
LFSLYVLFSFCSFLFISELPVRIFVIMFIVSNFGTVTCMSDYGVDLLITLTHTLRLHFTVHCYTHMLWRSPSVTVSKSHCLLMEPIDGDSSSSVLMSLLSDKHFIAEHTVSLGSSVYSLGVNPTENTASNSPTSVVMGSDLVTAQLLLTCLLAITKQRNVPSRSHCTAIVLHATVYLCTYL